MKKGGNIWNLERGHYLESGKGAIFGIWKGVIIESGMIHSHMYHSTKSNRIVHVRQ